MSICCCNNFKLKKKKFSFNCPNFFFKALYFLFNFIKENDCAILIWVILFDFVRHVTLTVVNFAIQLLVREQQVVQKVLKHATTQMNSRTFVCRPLNQLMNKRYFLEVPYDICKKRRR